MTRRFRSTLAPAILVAIGLLASTGLAVGLVDHGAWVLAGPLLLAVTTVAADRYGARLNGESGPSASAWIVATSIVLASAIVLVRDPAQVANLLPVLGVTSCVPVILRHERGGSACDVSA